MYAWEFQALQNIAKQHGWAQFISMQNFYNLLYREEEREMIPYCRDSGVGCIPVRLNPLRTPILGLLLTIHTVVPYRPRRPLPPLAGSRIPPRKPRQLPRLDGQPRQRSRQSDRGPRRRNRKGKGRFYGCSGNGLVFEQAGGQSDCGVEFEGAD